MTDIWLTGSDSDQVLTRVMGRYLTMVSQLPTGYPNAVMPDPLAIQIGSSVSFGYGTCRPRRYVGHRPGMISVIINGVQDPAPNTRQAMN